MSIPSRMRRALPCAVAGALIPLSLALVSPAALAASQTPVAARDGMVVSAQKLATRVGVDVLRQGGNAIDAAVAVGYALAVVYPAAGNLGGGGFMTLQLADGRKTFIDFREKAPMAATADMYLDNDGNVVKGLSTRGHLAVGVPGSVAGLEYARVKYGTLPRQRLIAPAIGLADRGFILDQGDVDMLRTATDDLKTDRASAAIFVKNGRAFKIGERLVQKDLADTLRAISRQGSKGFYTGRVAEAIAKSSRAGKGLITTADLEQYRVREMAPVECSYRGYGIVSAPPPSSGGVAICEMLNILEGYSMENLGYRSAQSVHLQIEAMRHAYVDRNSYLGDPDFVQNPIDRLLDKDYAAKIRAAIDPKKAGVSKDIKPGVPPHEGSNTTHYSIADRHGNAASVTYTLNDWFGARVTAGGTGVLLNNEMDDFTIKLGAANMYGLVQGETNAIAPGKRPLSSMSPTIVSRDGKPVLVLGTPGGSRIITVTALVLLNLIDYGMTVQEAVDMPRFHQQWLPDVTNVEQYGFSPDTTRILREMGHELGKPQPANHMAAIIIGAPSLGGKPVGNYRFFGANDPRRNTGLALGY